MFKKARSLIHPRVLAKIGGLLLFCVETFFPSPKLLKVLKCAFCHQSGSTIVFGTTWLQEFLGFAGRLRVSPSSTRENSGHKKRRKKRPDSHAQEGRKCWQFKKNQTGWGEGKQRQLHVFVSKALRLASLAPHLVFHSPPHQDTRDVSPPPANCRHLSFKTSGAKVLNLVAKPKVSSVPSYPCLQDFCKRKQGRFYKKI